MDTRKVFKVRLDLGNQLTQFSSIYEYYIEEAALIRAVVKDQLNSGDATTPYLIPTPNNASYFNPYLFKFGIILRSQGIAVNNHPFSDINAKKQVIVSFTPSIDNKTMHVVYAGPDSTLHSCLINKPRNLPTLAEDKQKKVVSFTIDTNATQRNLPEDRIAAQLQHFVAPENFFVKPSKPNNAIDDFLSECKETLAFINHELDVNKLVLQTFDSNLSMLEDKPNSKPKPSPLSAITLQIKHIIENREKLTERSLAIIPRLQGILLPATIKTIKETHALQSKWDSLHSELVGALHNAAIEYALIKKPLNETLQGAIMDEINQNNSARQEINRKFAGVARITIIPNPRPSKDMIYATELVFDANLSTKTFKELDGIAEGIKNQREWNSSAKSILKKHYDPLKKKLDETKTFEQEDAMHLFSSMQTAFKNERDFINKTKQDILTLRVMLLTIFSYYFDSLQCICNEKVNMKLSNLVELADRYALDFSVHKIKLRQSITTLNDFHQNFLQCYEVAIKNLTEDKSVDANLKATSILPITQAFQQITTAATHCKSTRKAVTQDCQSKVALAQQQEFEQLAREQKAIYEKPKPQTACVVKKRVVHIMQPPESKSATLNPLPNSLAKLRDIFLLCTQIDYWHAQVWGLRGSDVKLKDPKHKGKKISVPKIIYHLLTLLSNLDAQFLQIMINSAATPTVEQLQKANSLLAKIQNKIDEADGRQTKRGCFGFVRQAATREFIAEINHVIADQTGTSFFTALKQDVKNKNKEILHANRKDDTFTFCQVDLESIAKDNPAECVENLTAYATYQNT